jgi:hypothetical protein
MSQHRFNLGMADLKRMTGDGALGTLLIGEASTNQRAGQVPSGRAGAEAAAGRGVDRLAVGGRR